MNTTSSWCNRVDDYIKYRQALGFALTNEAGILRNFGLFMDAVGTPENISVTHAVQWARTSKRETPITWERRLEVIRGFSKHWQRFNATSEVVPSNWFGPAHRRLVPHIYTEVEILTLMEGTNQLTPINGLRPATCRTIFGLLLSTGLRISEATNLKRQDVDLEAAVLTIRNAKFHKSRLVPFDPSVTAALHAYTQMRDRIVLHPQDDHFFLFDNGHPVGQYHIQYVLRRLCEQLGWHPRGDYVYHRLQDMRHTYIVRSILRFYQQGIEVDRAVLALATYVGHAHVGNTYWYVTGIPELMSIAAERFEQFTLKELK